VGDDGGSCIVCALCSLEPAFLLYTVYFETFPLGCNGGNQETNMLSAVNASALMPAGGPGTVRRINNISLQYHSIIYNIINNIIFCYIKDSQTYFFCLLLLFIRISHRPPPSYKRLADSALRHLRL